MVKWLKATLLKALGAITLEEHNEELEAFKDRCAAFSKYITVDSFLINEEGRILDGPKVAEPITVLNDNCTLINVQAPELRVAPWVRGTFLDNFRVTEGMATHIRNTHGTVYIGGKPYRINDKMGM